MQLKVWRQLLHARTIFIAMKEVQILSTVQKANIKMEMFVCRAQLGDIAGQQDQEVTIKEPAHLDTFAKERHGLNIHTMQVHLTLSSKFSHLTMVTLTLAITLTLTLHLIKNASHQPIKTLKALLNVSHALKDFIARQMVSGLPLLCALEEPYAHSHLQQQLMAPVNLINFVKMEL